MKTTSVAPPQLTSVSPRASVVLVRRPRRYRASQDFTTSRGTPQSRGYRERAAAVLAHAAQVRRRFANASHTLFATIRERVRSNFATRSPTGISSSRAPHRRRHLHPYEVGTPQRLTPLARRTRSITLPRSLYSARRPISPTPLPVGGTRPQRRHAH